MATKKIRVSLDNMTLGDLEDLERGSFVSMLRVFEHTVKIEGVPDDKIPEEIRKLHWMQLRDIGDAIRKAVDEVANPVEEGKN